MNQYRFTGETEEVFPSLGRLLQPGDVVDIEKDPAHPRLERVKTPKPDKEKS